MSVYTSGSLKVLNMDYIVDKNVTNYLEISLPIFNMEKV